MLAGMNLSEFFVLLPCHSLEDFPTYHTGDAAEGLLAAWSALWHPRLLAAALKTPGWRRADDPPPPAEGQLVVVPTVADYELPSEYVASAMAVGAVVIQGFYRRKDIVERALAALDGGSNVKQQDQSTESQVPGSQSQVSAAGSLPSASLATDFLSVGLAYLLAELLTRRMRYMSNLDETAFADHMLAAATAATAGDERAARDRLRGASEKLYEARSHFYPVDTYLIDLTLVAEATLGASLRQELAGQEPLNLMVSGEVIEQIAAREPATLAALRERLQAKTLTLVGGECRETELPLLSHEAILEEIGNGHRVYEKHLGLRPDVFGRRRAGLTPALPQVLRGLNYKGALHFTLDDGRFPQADRGKTLWEGTSSTAIDAIGRVPLDATQAASILALPEKLGESMDHDFVSMLVFAHWPGSASEYYEDLRRVAKYAPVLGKFITLDEFFTSTDAAGAFSKFESDEYRSPYLAQAVRAGATDPLSSHVRRRIAEQIRCAAATLTTWTSLLTRGLEPSAFGRGQGEGKEGVTDKSNSPLPNPLPEGEGAGLRPAQFSFAAALCSARAGNPAGALLINSLSFARRAVVDVSALASPPDVAGSAVAVDAQVGKAIVEVPAHGFVWVAPGRNSQKKNAKAGKPIARENALVNELCEVTIHPETGGIRSIRDLHARGNRLSQQIAMRLSNPVPMPAGLWRDPDEGIIYSQMVADSIAITSNSSVLGEITSGGRLTHPDGSELAGFVQRVRLPAGRAAIEIDIELVPHELPRADAWSSYYACRFAWSEELCELRRSVHGASFASDLKRLEAPDFVEIVGTKARTAILTGGLPYHQRIGPRMLDTLLVVHGETARRFHLGIALEHLQPWQPAQELTAPSPVVPGIYPLPVGASTGWLFHIDARHVAATNWAPLMAGNTPIGFKARLLESAGHGGSVTLRTFRDVSSAHRLTLAGERAEELPVDGDRFRIEISGHEWMQFEARWK
jgi:alpha-mannosidase